MGKGWAKIMLETIKNILLHEKLKKKAVLDKGTDQTAVLGEPESVQPWWAL